MPNTSQKITPCLWFDSNCEEAIEFYTRIFPNSKINAIQRYPADLTDGPMADIPSLGQLAGKVLTAIFELDGYSFQALDGGPMFTLNPSISFMLNFDPSVDPDARQKLEALWAQLSDGGQALMGLGAYPFSELYGWVQDRFGVTWQLILTDPAGEPRPHFIPSMLFVGDVCGRAEEALRYYSEVFPDSHIGTLARYPAGMEPDAEGSVMFGEAALSGEWVNAMDSAHPHRFAFNEAISLSVECQDQAEIDHFWDLLSAVPEAEQCGWVKDRFGVSWQIVPKQLGEFLGDADTERSARVMEAVLSMKKLDIAKLRAAYDG